MLGQGESSYSEVGIAVAAYDVSNEWLLIVRCKAVTAARLA